MTGQEMVYNFQQLLQTIDSSFSTKDRLDTFVILDFLNRASERYIKTQYFSGQSFKENTAKLKTSLDDLSMLITMTDVSDDPAPTFTPVAGMGGAYSTPMPNDFLGYIRSDTLLTRTTVLPISSGWLPNTEIDFADVGPLLTTALNKPILEKPLVLFKNDDGVFIDQYAIQHRSLIIIVDSYTTLENVLITYVRKPTAIDMDGAQCELASYIHEEIVRFAVSMFFDEYKSKLMKK